MARSIDSRALTSISAAGAHASREEEFLTVAGFRGADKFAARCKSTAARAELFATPTRLRRIVGMLGAVAISASLLATLTLTTGVWRYQGDDVDHAIQVIFLDALKAPAAPTVRRWKIHVRAPNPEALPVNLEPTPELRSPPTETAESLRIHMAAERGNNGDGAAAHQSLPCSLVNKDEIEVLPHPVAVLIHVGLDGRAVEVELDTTSGNPKIDEALVQCARSWGPFPLAIIGGRILEAWQRVNWPAESAPMTANP
jgi:hypothetical protein